MRSAPPVSKPLVCLDLKPGWRSNVSSISFGELFNILVWGVLVVGVSWLLIVGFESVILRSIPLALRAAILLPVALSVALTCAAIFPLPF